MHLILFHWDSSALFSPLNKTSLPLIFFPLLAFLSNHSALSSKNQNLLARQFCDIVWNSPHETCEKQMNVFCIYRENRTICGGTRNSSQPTALQPKPVMQLINTRYLVVYLCYTIPSTRIELRFCPDTEYWWYNLIVDQGQYMVSRTLALLFFFFQIFQFWAGQRPQRDNVL